MIKNKVINTHIPMGRCEIVVYAGHKGRRTIAYRKIVQFDTVILSKGLRGIINKQDLLAYKQNTINEYVYDVKLTLKENLLINPEISIIFNSYKEDSAYISKDDVFNELIHTETETDANILKEKIKNNFGDEFYE